MGHFHRPRHRRGGREGRVTKSGRSPAEVVKDHLRLPSERKLEDDLARNYAPDVVVFGSEGRFDGHEGVREAASILRNYVADGDYEYLEREADGAVAFITWKAQQDGAVIHGSDTFLIRDDRIVVQTIPFVRTESGR